MLVTAGPTEEPIDPVRVITNPSSGKMGYAVARAAREAGAEVTLISGPVSLPTPPGVSRVDVRTAQEMFEAVKKDAKSADVFIAVAAVADYRVKNPSAQKLKKAQRPPVARARGEPGHPRLGGGAAEAAVLRRLRRREREPGAVRAGEAAKKKLPLIAANLAQEALGRDDNAITLYDARGEHPLGRGPKIELARKLVEHVAGMLPPQK